VPVRVEFPNPDGRHHARTFGTAQVILRKEPRAVVVPNEAVHWEGDCNVVFVRDKRFDEPGVPKVFHVRSVRPGVKNGPNTEIIAGLLPGELVATRGSGILRSQLLKNNLGAG
jgi:cobalt-zinc-cadmium efflux system membrane fusion protein